MREDRKTFWDLMVGIVLFSALFGIIGAMLAEDTMAFFLGVVLGGAVAAGLCVHMYKTLEVTLDMDEGRAQKRAYAMTGIRMFIMAAAVFAALRFSELLDVIGVVLGILTLKFAAFAQPLIRKGITTKIFGKGR